VEVGKFLGGHVLALNAAYALGFGTPILEQVVGLDLIGSEVAVGDALEVRVFVTLSPRRSSRLRTQVACRSRHIAFARRIFYE
jgi:hypothetical protein